MLPKLSRKAQAHHFEDQNLSLDEIANRNAMWCYLRAALRGDQEAQYKMGLKLLKWTTWVRPKL
jgi:hypothetical protein